MCCRKVEKVAMMTSKQLPLEVRAVNGGDLVDQFCLHLPGFADGLPPTAAVVQELGRDLQIYVSHLQVTKSGVFKPFPTSVSERPFNPCKYRVLVMCVSLVYEGITKLRGNTPLHGWIWPES